MKTDCDHVKIVSFLFYLWCFRDARTKAATLSQQQCYHLLMAFSGCLHQGSVALIINLDTNRSIIR